MFKEEINDIHNKIDSIEARLDSLCNVVNSNASSLKTLVSAFESSDFVRSVTPLYNGGVEVGYEIEFTKSGKVTILHGQDGTDGNDGSSAAAPVIGVKKDADGKWYWTVNGEWLLDGDGNKVCANGIQGETGVTGQPGQNGEDGKDGEDGKTPVFKIENDLWYVSYDDGATWTAVKVSGESTYTDIKVEYTADYVAITLPDGTKLKMPTLDAFNALASKVDKLNSDIIALQAIVNSVEGRDYILSTYAFNEADGTGYVIEFASGKSIKVYNGNDGQDGEDGYTPQLGTKKDADGIIYWTLDGEYLLDEDGNKIKAVGVDGANGEDGKDGEDGFTPQFEIRESDGDWYWWIKTSANRSFVPMCDKNNNMIRANGRDGKDGKDGDSFFESVKKSEDGKYIIITLTEKDDKGNNIVYQVPTREAFDALELLCKELQNNVEAIKKLVSGKKYITKIESIYEKLDVIGYEIFYVEATDPETEKSIKIYNGTNGTNGNTPAIGVKEENGILYWTIDKDGEGGNEPEFLMHNGAKIPVTGKDGEDGITPTIEVKNGTWWINGKDTGIPTTGEPGTDGDAFFKGVDNKDPNYVIFTLTDGSQIKLPTWAAFEALQRRVTDLETAVKALQAFQAIAEQDITTLKQCNFVEKVESTADGYKITFKYTVLDGKNYIEIKHGAKGDPGKDGHNPVVTIDKDGYWVIDGVNTGVKAVGVDGKNGETPEFKIDENNGVKYWYYKFPSDTEWRMINVEAGAYGATGDAFFKSCVDKNGYVTITLNDGNDTKIELPNADTFNALLDRVTTLETTVTGWEATIKNLMDNGWVKKIVEDGDNWVITYGDNTTATIAAAKDGENGHTPVMGIKQDTDGNWYWTVDGEWLLNGTDKVQVYGKDGEDGKTPSFKIKDGVWYYTFVTNPTTDSDWTPVPSEGDVPYLGQTSVEEFKEGDYTYIRITMPDGKTTFEFPTKKTFDALQATVATMNQNIEAIQEIIEAIKDKKYIKSWEAIEGGYRLTLTTLTAGAADEVIEIKHGTNGTDGTPGADGKTPVIGVAEYKPNASAESGVLCWTLDPDGDGEEEADFIKDAEGEPIPVTGNDGANGLTPEFKIDAYTDAATGTTSQWWFIKFPGDEDWTAVGQARGDDGADGDAFFKSVEPSEDGAYLVITLKNGNVYNVPMVPKLAIKNLPESKRLQTAGEDIKFTFNVEGAIGTTYNVYTICEGSWYSETPSISGNTVNMTIRPLEGATEGKILIFVANNGAVVMDEVLLVKGDVSLGGTTPGGATISNGVITLAWDETAAFNVTGTSEKLALDNVTVDTDCDWLHEVGTKAMSTVTKSIYADFNESEKTRTAELWLLANGTKIGTFTVTQNGRIDLSATETANCYIVSGNGTYAFKATKGFGGAVVNGEFAGNTSNITKVRKSQIGANVWVSFEISNWSESNGFISVTDGTTTLWSWHIWCTNAKEVGTTGILDRNLGAAATADAGYLYQWGRKDPFMFDTTHKPSIKTGGSYENGVKNPNVFYSDWNDGSWATNGKTVNDPCPVGYCVPTSAQLPPEGTTGVTASGVTYNGVTYPLTDHVENGEYVTKASAETGLYWTTTDSDNNKVQLLVHNGNDQKKVYNGKFAGKPSFGHAVRCIKK